MKKLISAFICIVLVLAVMSNPAAAAKKDTKAPAVTKTNPVEYGTDTMVDGTIIIRFSESILKGKNIAKITLLETETKKVGFTYEINGKFLKITPKEALNFNTFYTVTIPAAAVKDSAGNNFAKTYAFNFVTEEDPLKTSDKISSGKDIKYVIELEATLDEELTPVKIAYFEKMLEQFGINASFRNVYIADQK